MDGTGKVVNKSMWDMLDLLIPGTRRRGRIQKQRRSFALAKAGRISWLTLEIAVPGEYNNRFGAHNFHQRTPCASCPACDVLTTGSAAKSTPALLLEPESRFHEVFPQTQTSEHVPRAWNRPRHRPVEYSQGWQHVHARSYVRVVVRRR